MSILDSRGRQINVDCGSASFYADASRADKGWKTVNGDVPVSWKDWTTVGINLAQYDGETLTVRFLGGARVQLAV